MLTISVLAVEVIIWQSNDISVNIDSSTDKETEDLRISVLNTAGLTLLFFDNPYINGKIEYYNGETWEKFMDISYTDGNINAISPQYAGVFAELNPGETWKITIPKKMTANMKAGKYRVNLTYTTVSDYKKFISSKFNTGISNLNLQAENDQTLVSDSADFEFLESDSLAADTDNSNISDVSDVSDEEISEDRPFDDLKCEVFLKTFEYEVSDEDFGTYSFDDSDITIEPKAIPAEKSFADIPSANKDN